MNTKIKASIIVPAYNAESSLAACLQGLLGQENSAEIPHEIIVINDASTDDTLQIAQQIAQSSPIPIHIISEGRLGKSGTRNRGAQLAQGDILLFTDSDCVPTPNWIETMLAPFSDPDLVGLKGAYWSKQRSLVARFVQVEHEERYERMAKLPRIDFIDTYSAAYRRTIFLENGGFDEKLTHSMVEDQELSFRLAAQGHKLIFLPAARVYHQHITRPDRYFQRKFAIASWKALIVKRHPDRMVKDSRTPQMMKVQMGLALAMTPFIPLALRWKPARTLLVSLLVLFDITCLPFMWLSWRYDKAVLFVTEPLLLIRAFALAYGYIAGVLRWRGAASADFLDQ